MDVSAASGTLAVEGLNESAEEIITGETTSGGEWRALKAPFDGAAVLDLATNAGEI